MGHQVKFTVVPWDDPAFHAAVGRAEATVIGEGVPIDSPVAAAHLESALRAEGYPTARVEYQRTVDDVLSSRAHWTIRRDGP